VHAALVVPAGKGHTVKSVRSWVAQNWWEVVGSGDSDHRKAGTQCDKLKRSVVGYFLKNGVVDKSHQNVVPEAFQNVGRIWGLWGVKPEWRTINLQRAEFMRLRRTVRRLKRSKCKSTGRHQEGLGAFAISRSADRLMEWVIEGGVMDAL
jgi:hypothetical protein